MRSPEDDAGGDERLGEALPIEGAPAVWHDAPPPDDYLVEVADDDATDAGPAPVFADPVTLRPAARRTGGFRGVRRAPADALPGADQEGVGDEVAEASPIAFPPADPGPRMAARPAFGGGRPLPGVGTEALGRCVRLARYGAFVDFAGHRGLIHVSQLRPGFRVERVEDVIALGDEVVVRVIAVDYGARHLNLALVGPAPHGSTGAPGPAPVPDSIVPSRAPAREATDVTAPVAPVAVAPAPVAVAPAPVAVAPAPVAPAPVAAVAIEAGPPDATAPTMPVAPQAPAVMASPAAESKASAETAAPTQSRPVQSRPVGEPSPARPPAPPPTRRREIVGYVPGARVRPVALPVPVEADRPVARRAAPSRPPEVARSGSHAMRRELDDPNHPMARFLAMSPDLGVPARPARPASRPVTPTAAVEPVPVVVPEPPRGVPATRLVHADEPEPELPTGDAPATVEALAARFATRPAPASRDARTGRTSRSEAAREAQARMLEQLRRQR